MAKGSTKESDYGGLFDFAVSQEEVSGFSEPISTGSLKFDLFLGGGYRSGVARFGAPHEHGKTMQSLTWAREWLRKYENGEVIYIDAEGRLSEDKVEESGLTKLEKFKWADDLKSEGNFRVVIFNVYDHIANYFHKLILDNEKLKPKDKKRYFFVIDSLDSLIASKDLAKGFHESEQIGAAQVISAQVMKRIGAYMSKYGHHFHILSQIRANLDINNPNSPKTKLSGGNAMLHGPSIIGQIMKDWSGTLIYPSNDTKKDPIGREHSIKFLKTFNNKTHQILRIPIKYGHGIWLEREIIDVLLANGVMAQSGSWYSLSDIFSKELTKDYKGPDTLQTKWQGYDNIVTYLEKNSDLTKFLEAKIREVCLSVGTERMDSEEIDEHLLSIEEDEA